MIRDAAGKHAGIDFFATATDDEGNTAQIMRTVRVTMS